MSLPKPPPKPKQLELARCDAELAALEDEARAGNPDVPGIALGIADWSAERKLIEREGRKP